MFVLRTEFLKEPDHELQQRFIGEGIISVKIRVSHSGSVYAIDGKTCLVLG